MKDKLQDLILPIASYVLNRLYEEDTVYYECKDYKAYISDDSLVIRHIDSNINILVPILLIESYQKET